MRLSELAAYAMEKYEIPEQFQWAEFPGFSVLCDPRTGKWAALLMRQKDPDTGMMIERCDIKCGVHPFSDLQAPYLTTPFRMHGKKWIGVRMDIQTDTAIVCHLFDLALDAGERRGYTLVLETPPRGSVVVETPPRGSVIVDNPARDRIVFPESRRESAGAGDSFFDLKPLPGEEAIPEKIREMKKMYVYGGGDFEEKRRNFYHQGMFMKDYEDAAPWHGIFRRYFPTYHDLNMLQLRGYFTWRTDIRKGIYKETSDSFVYIYLYELINGIGTESVLESLQKMKAFEEGYPVSGTKMSGAGDAGIRKNLRRWMAELAVISRLPAETAGAYADPGMLAQDAALAALKDPEMYTDGEVYHAICQFSDKKLAESPVNAGDGALGMHLFAGVWRRAMADSSGDDIFTACFGTQQRYSWFPLANAVWYRTVPAEDGIFELNPCRRYICKNGLWQEERYDPLYFDLKHFRGLMHAADRAFRRYLKTGRYLKEKPEEAWAAGYAAAVIEAHRQEVIEAARPKINIDLTGLDRIRRDALLTQDMLEKDMPAPEAPVNAAASAEAAPTDAAATVPEAPVTPAPVTAPPPVTAPDTPPAVPTLPAVQTPPAGLDALQAEILLALLRGVCADPILKENHMMPSIAADGINEALFDEIGDTVLICEDDRLEIIEDYREDLEMLLGSV